MVRKENVNETRTFSSVKNKDPDITRGKFQSRSCNFFSSCEVAGVGLLNH